MEEENEGRMTTLNELHFQNGLSRYTVTTGWRKKKEICNFLVFKLVLGLGSQGTKVVF